MDTGTAKEKIEKYYFYKEEIKNMTKEEKIKWLEDLEWNIEMVDRWQKDEWVSIDAVRKLLKEIKEELWHKNKW